jgi:hypothetical protein
MLKALLRFTFTNFHESDITQRCTLRWHVY